MRSTAYSGCAEFCAYPGPVSAAGVSRSRPAGPRAAAEAELTGQIRSIHGAVKGAYGVPQITRELSESGPAVNHKRVVRLMRAAGITGRHLRVDDSRNSPVWVV
ncbi:IS3 family transposase [Streptomyces sp. CBMA29]|uniref:IS3 family transposase n=1 Tax=Streptomyces sp. CBMA29 TaxID=1896314 RepID=UPI001661BFCB|nr:IS3 family transposase [Streptomyces sp. CBMA29]